MAKKKEARKNRAAGKPKEGMKDKPRGKMKFMLEIYKYAQQGTYGDLDYNKTPEPSRFFDIKGHAKWEAWNSLRGTDPGEARKKFLELVQPKLEEMGISEEDPKKDEIVAKYEKCK